MNLRFNQDLARRGLAVRGGCAGVSLVVGPEPPIDEHRREHLALRLLAQADRSGTARGSRGVALSEGIKLRYNWPNLVKVELSQVPGWLRDIVAVALDAGWIVLRSGAALVLYTPDGLSYETIECDEPGITTGLVRHAILRRLQRLGLPMHYGTRGQSLPGRDREDQLSKLTPDHEDEAMSG